ncbi:MAG: ANTAR domain-containing protein [Azospirillaceae bacterium]|nr:ANTAR domain-containing protein [Azospirillaceae bacterium]
MSLKILLIDSDPERAQTLADTLAGAGFSDILRVTAGGDLVETVQRLLPDLVIIDMALPDRDALEDIRALTTRAPRPIVMVADEDDPAFVAAAIAAGVCSYNLSGVSHRDIQPIVASAIALFRRYNHVETELAVANALLDERRLIERAKALLMRERKMTEPAAYKWLRRTAMDENRKLAQVAAELLKGEGTDERQD